MAEGDYSWLSLGLMHDEPTKRSPAIAIRERPDGRFDLVVAMTQADVNRVLNLDLRLQAVEAALSRVEAALNNPLEVRIVT